MLSPITRLLGAFLLSAAVSLILYTLFFHFAPVIRSTDFKIPPSDIMPMSRDYITEHDGMEPYVLYGMALMGVFISSLLMHMISTLKGRLIYFILYVPIGFLALLYLVKIGFYPPAADPIEDLKGNTIPILTSGVITGLLYFMNRWSWKITAVLIAMLLFPVCFIALSPASSIDYSYILAPSLRLLYGVKISEIYFQYDLLPSLLGLAWMKMGADPYLFERVVQFSVYAFFIGMFLFTRFFFGNKSLSVLLLIFLVLIRSYANIKDIAALPQVSPLRLDLWLILLAVIYWKGPHHWLPAFATGLMLLLHRNFGALYLAAYLQLLFILFVLEAFRKSPQDSYYLHIKETLKKHMRLNLPGILIMGGFVLVTAILFKGFVPASLKLYMNPGLGMIPVSVISFYWYVPVLLGVLAALLLRNHKITGDKYFVTGFFVLLLTVANCMYFNGRSHEHNLINISGILSLALFLIFDLVGMDYENKSWKKAPGKVLVFLMPFLAILIVLLTYGSRIITKFNIQADDLTQGHFIYPFSETPASFDAVKQLTHASNKVYFLDFRRDFLHYYYGHYKPLGFFNPCASWLVKKDYAVFLQQRLDDHYYVVTSQDFYEDKMEDEMLPLLNYNRVENLGGYRVIYKDSIQSQNH